MRRASRRDKRDIPHASPLHPPIDLTQQGLDGKGSTFSLDLSSRPMWLNSPGAKNFTLVVSAGELHLAGGTLSNCTIVIPEGTSTAIFAHGTRFHRVTIVGQGSGTFSVGDFRDVIAEHYNTIPHGDFALDMTQAWGFAVLSVPSRLVLPANAPTISTQDLPTLPEQLFDSDHALTIAALARGLTLEDRVRLLPMSPDDHSLDPLISPATRESGDGFGIEPTAL